MDDDLNTLRSNKFNLSISEVDELADKIVDAFGTPDYRSWYCKLIYTFGTGQVEAWLDRAIKAAVRKHGALFSKLASEALRSVKVSNGSETTGSVDKVVDVPPDIEKMSKEDFEKRLDLPDANDD